MRDVIQDLRYGLRLLRKSPAFTSFAVVMLGVGIGANTAIYTLIDQALVRSLPVKQANRLVLLRYSGVNNGFSFSRNDDHLSFSFPMYRDLRDHNSVLAGLIATSWTKVGVEWHKQSEMADAELISGNYFDVLGVQPALGRLLVASDDLAQGASPVAVLSFNYWQQRFGSEAKILNQSISINGHPFTVVGVATMKMSLIVGREIEAEDTARSEKVAVVNESFAKRYFQRPQDALGHYFGSGGGNVKPDIEIVGVIEDARHSNLRENMRRAVFTPYLQDEQFGQFGRFGLTFYVRTWQAPESAEATIGAAIHAVDSKLVLSNFRTMREQLEQSLTDEQGIAFLATSFGVLAAFLAAIGTYGVLAYSTAQRTREIGIRVALGARRIEIIRLVLNEVFLLAGSGVAAGLPLALLFAGAVRSELFGVSHYDPLTLLCVCILIVVVALTSAALPARRAAKVDPLVALRYE